MAFVPCSVLVRAALGTRLLLLGPLGDAPSPGHAGFGCKGQRSAEMVAVTDHRFAMLERGGGDVDMAQLLASALPSLVHT